MNNLEEKKNKRSYYTGWGIAYGTSLGSFLSVVFIRYLLPMFFVGIVIGGVLGAIYGELKTRDTKKSNTM